MGNNDNARQSQLLTDILNIPRTILFKARGGRRRMIRALNAQLTHAINDIARSLPPSTLTTAIAEDIEPSHLANNQQQPTTTRRLESAPARPSPPTAIASPA